MPDLISEAGFVDFRSSLTDVTLQFPLEPVKTLQNNASAFPLYNLPLYRSTLFHYNI